MRSVVYGALFTVLASAGTVGATSTVINAIIDALAPLGVTDIEMPTTPQRIWKAIQGATRISGGTDVGVN